MAAIAAGLVAGVMLDPFDGTSSSAAGPSRDARALERLDDQRMVLRARLSAGETPQEQAAAAADLSDAYGAAARAADSRPLVAAAQAAERAYAELGAASDDGSADRFAAATEEVGRAERRLAAAAAPSR